MGRITERYDEYLPHLKYDTNDENELFELLCRQTKILSEKGMDITLSASSKALKIYTNKIYSGIITPYHNHLYYELNYVRSGKVVEYVDGKKLVLTDGDIMLMSPSVKHCAHPVGEADAINIIVSANYAVAAERMLSETDADNCIKLIVSGNSYAAFHCKRRHRLNYIIEELERINRNRWEYGAYIDSELKNLSDSLFLLLARETIFEHSYQKITKFSEAIGKKPASEYINGRDDRIMWYINDNYNTISRKSLAEHFGYSGQQIARIVKKRTGMSFTTYIQVLRLARATDLLTSTDLSVKKIAEAVGMESAEHFTRWFKKEHNATPTGYRERYRRKQYK